MGITTSLQQTVNDKAACTEQSRGIRCAQRHHSDTITVSVGVPYKGQNYILNMCLPLIPITPSHLNELSGVVSKCRLFYFNPGRVTLQQYGFSILGKIIERYRDSRTVICERPIFTPMAMVKQQSAI